MRVLVVHPGPQFSVQDVYTGYVEALRAAGCEVKEFNLADRLRFYQAVLMADPAEAGTYRRVLDGPSATELAVNGLYADIFRSRPDVLLSVSSFFVPPDCFDLARAYGVKVVMLHTESPYEDDRQLEIAAHADLNLINDPMNLAAYQALNAPAMYMPHAYRPALHKPGPPDRNLASDFAFVGTGFPARISFLEAMDLDGLDVLLAGNWARLGLSSPLRKHVAHDIDECIDNVQAVDIYRSMRVGINLYRQEAQRPGLIPGVAMGPREVEMAACGAFFLRDSRPEGDDVLSMLPTVSTPAEASDLLRYYLGRPELAAKLADQARAAIVNRTFDHHARRLLRLIEKGK